MKIDKAGLDLIKKFEGFSSKPYLDIAGVPTIGYGTTHHESRAVSMGDPEISQRTAEYLLKTQVDETYGRAVNHYVRVPINQDQFDALVSFAYNLGTNALKKSTLLRYLNLGEYDRAANEFRKWSHANGRVSKGLLARRELEQELFLA
jgi:lysozyme